MTLPIIQQAPPGIMIASNTTLNVPATYATIALALASLDEKRIAADVTVTIQVADGTYTLTASDALTWQHPDSARIRVRGNTGTPANVVLNYSGQTFTAFYVGAGQVLDINGFTINHTNSAARANTICLLADEGGYILSGANMVMDGFYWNLFARRGGMIRAESGGIYRDAGDANALAYLGGHVSATGCTLSGANDSATSLGSGAVCEGGSMDLTSATLTGNKRAGLHIIDGHVRADGTDFSSNTNDGILQDGGVLDLAAACTAGANGAYGYNWNDGDKGTLLNIANLAAGGAGANGTALYKAYVRNLYSSQPGIAVVSPATNESMRIDSKGTGSIYMNTGGGLQLEIANVASAVNYIQAKGAATGGVVILSAQGSDTDIALQLWAKGADGVQLVSRSLVAFEAFNNASAVNWIGARGVATGSAPDFECLGSDTNIDLALIPKGTGVVKFGTHSALAAETVSGYITIKDSGGTSRKLAVVS